MIGHKDLKMDGGNEGNYKEGKILSYNRSGYLLAWCNMDCC